MTAQAFLKDQLEDLRDSGWDVHLVTSPDEGYDNLLALPGISLHPLPMRRPPAPFADIRSLVAWILLLRRVKPAVIVTSTPKAGLLGTLAGWLTRVPRRVYHLRGLRAEGLKGSARRLSICAERISIACSTSVLCDSASLLSKLRSLGLLGRTHGIVLGQGSCCGVNTDYFRPPSSDERESARAKLNLPFDAVIVGFVGRLVPDKGVIELVKAIHTLRSINSSVVLVLVGQREKPVVQMPPPSDGLMLVGHTDNVRSYYWAFDIVCLPSHREGFPIAPLEAQACGLPVVTTTATGCIDSILNGKTGRLVPVGDSAALSSALADFVEDASMRLRFGNAARSWVIENFDSRSVRERVLDFLNESNSGTVPTREAE